MDTEQPAREDTGDIPVTVRSMYGYKSQQPLVMLVIGEKVTQLPVAKAREIAGFLLEASESAEQDGFIVRFAVEKLGTTQEQATLLLREFRAMREEGSQS